MFKFYGSIRDFGIGHFILIKDLSVIIKLVSNYKSLKQGASKIGRNSGVFIDLNFLL